MIEAKEISLVLNEREALIVSDSWNLLAAVVSNRALIEAAVDNIHIAIIANHYNNMDIAGLLDKINKMEKFFNRKR